MSPVNRIKNSFSYLIKPLTFADRILLALLIVLALSSLFLFSFFQKQGENVQIFQNNKLKYQLSLSENENLMIDSSDGFIEIFIRNEKVWVNDSSCSAKICKKMGKISKTGQTIVCVPNRIFIQIVGKSNNKYIDLITQ